MKISFNNALRRKLKAIERKLKAAAEYKLLDECAHYDADCAQS